jgi:hypothetical protein
MSEAEFLWTVSDHTDTIQKRKSSVRDQMWYGVPLYKSVFDTEAEAKKFVVNRAQKLLQKAKDQLKSAQRRVAKCEKKFKQQ